VRVLHLSWEYPPVVYGGLGRHVHALAEAQAAAGHEVAVVTQGTPELPRDERINGVRIVRTVPDNPLGAFDDETLIPWVTSLDHAMARTGVRLLSTWSPQVVHGHDWLVAHATTTLAQASGMPLVATIHATEAGRHQGWLPTHLSRTIHSVESWFTHEANRIIACSTHMRWEITRLFDVPVDRVEVIPNGIDLTQWRVASQAREAARCRWAPDGPLVVFLGRMEWEKGGHVLLDAMPTLLRRFPGLRLVLAGRGSMEDRLHEQSARLGLAGAVTFTGWLPEDDLHALVACADVAVVPSIYEPFGLVALEAAALGTPLVVSDTGGLAEFVEPGETGWRFPPGDAPGLADAVTATLTEPALAAASARRALVRLHADHGWDRIAERTVEAYVRAAAERLTADPDGRRTWHLQVGEGNLLRDAPA
jgi:glycogen synthase